MIPIEQILVLLLTSKACPRCETRKGLGEFYPSSTNATGVGSWCKACDCGEKKLLSRDRKDAANERHKLRVKARTPEQKRHWLEYGKAYRQRNRVKLQSQKRVRVRHKLRNNPEFRLKHYLRYRTWAALKRNVKSAATLELLGCPIEALTQHLEALFVPGMTWENYGPVWHVDHKRPCASFDLSDPVQQRECFRYTNLQPLFAQENLSKGAKIL